MKKLIAKGLFYLLAILFGSMIIASSIRNYSGYSGHNLWYILSYIFYFLLGVFIFIYGIKGWFKSTRAV